MFPKNTAQALNHTWHCKREITAQVCPRLQFTNEQKHSPRFVVSKHFFFFLVLVSGNRVSLLPRLASLNSWQFSCLWLLSPGHAEITGMHITLVKALIPMSVASRHCYRLPFTREGSKAQRKADSGAGTKQQHRTHRTHSTRFFTEMRDSQRRRRQPRSTWLHGQVNPEPVEMQLQMTESSFGGTEAAPPSPLFFHF